MNKRNFAVLALGIIALCLVLLSAAGSARAAGAQQSEPVVQIDPVAAGTVVVDSASPMEIRQTRRMWSRSARLQATPLDTIMLSAEDLAAARLLDEPATDLGQPGYSPSSDVDSAATLPIDPSLEWASPMSGDATDALAFTAYLGNYYSSYWKVSPYYRIGRLFFKTSSGAGGSCSASVIGPNTIVTAAHCVYDTDTNRSYTNFSFCPAYRAGTCPYGTFSWTRRLILTNYINASRFVYGIRYDVALVELGKNSSGKGVHQMVGYMGRSWNQGYTQSVRTVGYPGKFYNGAYSWICNSSTISAGTDIMEMGCNSGPGHSGGPWVRSFGSGNYVNNVMSYGYTSGTLKDKHMGAARFSSSNIVPLCDASPGC